MSQLYLALGQGDKIIAGSDAIRLCVMWPSTPAERGEAEPEEEVVLFSLKKHGH